MTHSQRTSRQSNSAGNIHISLSGAKPLVSGFRASAGNVFYSASPFLLGLYSWYRRFSSILVPLGVPQKVNFYVLLFFGWISMTWVVLKAKIKFVLRVDII